MKEDIKSIVGFAVFPGVMKYFDDFANSLNRQTDNNFDIIAVVENVNCDEIKKKFSNNKVDCIEKSKTNIAENRQSLILYAKQMKAENIIFGDCDDFFSPNRIVNTKEYLKEYDIVFNELELCGQGIENKKVLAGRISNESDFREEILSKNFIGFSNSGLNLKIIDSNFFIPNDIKAADWWLYSYLMLKNKCKVYFDSSAVTYYRQHESNIIGWNKFCSKEDLMLQADEKIKHYKYLLGVCSEAEGSIKIQMQGTIRFKKSISDSEYFNRHRDFINKVSKKINLLWWEQLQSIENLKGVWSNEKI